MLITCSALVYLDEGTGWIAPPFDTASTRSIKAERDQERESYILLSAQIFSLSLRFGLPTGTCSLYLFEIDDDEKVGRNRILDYAVAVHVHRGILNVF
jgi:hypothetical protein